MSARTAEPDILVVEDDTDIAQLVGDVLRRNGMRPTLAHDAGSAERHLKARKPDLVLLDVMLPDASGLSLAPRLTERYGVPFIMLTAMGEEADRVTGLEIGADDYVVKPFSARELVARIRAVLRRTGESGPSCAVRDERLAFDGWTLDLLMRHLVDPDGVEVALTTGEFELLRALCENPRKVLNRETLIDLTRGPQAAPFDRSIDVLVSRIRQKIEANPKAPRLLKTVRLGGYVFTPEVAIR